MMDQATLEAWGREVGAQLEGPTVLLLEGPLGAGKSTFARAVARGAGVQGPMPSPTFNLVFRYPIPGDGSFVHVDLYRLESPAEVTALGWEELFDGPTVVVIEWPERAGDMLPSNRWEISLGIDPSKPDFRTVQVESVGMPPKVPALALGHA